MTITYHRGGKEMKALEEYISNPQDPKSRRKVQRYFNEIDDNIIKIHQKLLAADNALIYNQIATDNNKIEITKGSKDKEPLILKLRVSSAYRKFFHSVESGGFLLKKNWNNQFDQIIEIFVIDLNKHNYNAV